MSSEMMFLTWFKESIQPSNSMLWVSAVAPDTFQGDARFLEELLKGPLEVPDAMGQQRASARYSACLIAQALHNMNPATLQLVSLLHKFDFFQNPDLLIRKPFPDALQSQIKRLIREAFDPTLFWSAQLRTLSQYFQEGLHVLRTLFKVRRSSQVTPKLNSFFVSEYDWWGISYYQESNIVNIHPPFLFLPEVGKSLVLREAVRIFLPPCFQNAFDVQELANTLISELLNPQEQQLWSQIKWNGTTPTHEQLQWVAAIASILPKLIENKQLPSLYTRLNRINTLAAQVPTGSLTILAKQLLNEIAPKPVISQSQHQVLLALAENPMASERMLAKSTQLARGTISRNLTTLQEQFGLKFPGEINYQKLGLTPFLLTVHSSTGAQPGISKLKNLGLQLNKFPYCLRLETPHTLNKPVLYAIIVLPNSAISDFQQLLEQWQETVELSPQLFQINQFDRGWNFTYWKEFPSEEWKILASSSLRPEGSQFNIISSIHYQPPAIKLTREGLRTLLILENDMRFSQRKLAQLAQTSVTTATTYHNRLIPKVITPYLRFEKPPLPEGLITLIHCPSKDSCNQMIAGIRLLPMFQAWHLKSLMKPNLSTLLVTLNLPQGALIPFTKALQDVTSFYDAIEFNPLLSDYQLPQIHELPLALFKTVGQEWLCSSMLLESLFHTSP
ncbi:MAG: MarR family transcriptional regulator [Promethearchaeota archaeon]